MVGERKIEAFLTDLAVRGQVAASTAMNALVFLYRKALEKPLDEVVDVVRSERKVHVPVVLTREEVARVVGVMEGVPQLIVKLLCGSGLRILEAVRLRVKDVDFEMKLEVESSVRCIRPSRPCGFGHRSGPRVVRQR